MPQRNKTPHVAFGNNELEGLPETRAGDTIPCPHCGQGHELQAAKDALTGKDSELLLFYRCGEASYVAGLGGKLVVSLFKKG